MMVTQESSQTVINTEVAVMTAFLAANGFAVKTYTHFTQEVTGRVIRTLKSTSEAVLIRDCYTLAMTLNFSCSTSTVATGTNLGLRGIILKKHLINLLHLPNLHCSPFLHVRPHFPQLLKFSKNHLYVRNEAQMTLTVLLLHFSLHSFLPLSHAQRYS